MPVFPGALPPCEVIEQAPRPPRFASIAWFVATATKQSASGHLESSLGQSFTLDLDLRSLDLDLLKIVLGEL